MIINPHRYATGGGGGITVEAYGSTNSGGSVTNQIFTAPSGITSGEILVLIVVSNASRTAPSGWTSLHSFNGSGVSQSVFWKLSDGTETDVTVTGSGYFCGWYCRISGADTTTPVHAVGPVWANSGTQGQVTSDDF